MDAQGEPARAQQLLRELAPDDAYGLAEAHRARAILMSESIDESSELEQRRILRWHLDHGGDRISPEIKRSWARYYISNQEYGKAIDLLKELTSRFPEVTATLARLYFLDGKDSLATRYLEQAEEYYRRTLRENPNDTDKRVEAVFNELQLKRIDDAIKTLEQGMRLDPDGPFQAIMAEVQVLIHDLKASEANATLPQLFAQLRIALSYDPNCRIAYERLVAYASADVGENLSLKSILSDLIADGSEPALAHFALGIVLWREDDFQQAQWHLEAAHRFAPELPFIANNLAWLLTMDPEPDLDRALRLATEAVEQAPTDARFLDTRGTIYLKQENWEQAINDLELTLRVSNQPAALHRKLEQAYHELGKASIAQSHRRRAEAAEQKAELDAKAEMDSNAGKDRF